MYFLASALAAIIPMITYLILIWRFDRYDREPFKLVLLNYLWGALGAIFFAIIGSLILTTGMAIFITEPEKLDNLSTIIVAPFVEEITKGIFLLITVANRKFDNLTDGIVYGGAIGLGFGMTENFFYFLSNSGSVSGWLTLVILRTLFSAVMHCVSTATFGAFLGFAKFKSTRKKFFYGFVGISVAMFIHFAWNFSVSFKETALIGVLFMILTVTIFIIVFTVSVKGERKIIYNELLSEIQSGLIPAEHLLILSSSVRDKFGWIDEKIRKQYIKAATTLAFRKLQLKNATGLSRIFYENDVKVYRNFISNLLNLD